MHQKTFVLVAEKTSMHHRLSEYGLLHVRLRLLVLLGRSSSVSLLNRRRCNGDGLPLLRRGLGDGFVDRGLEDGDRVRQRLAGTSLALGVGTLHDFDLDTEHTLSQQNVADSKVNKVDGGLTGVDHEAVGEFHGFSTRGTELARDDDLTTFGARLHDETEDTIACTADGETTEQLVSQALALGDSRETTVLNLLGVELERVLGKLETFLDESSELADTAPLLAQDFLGVGCTDDDLSAGVGDTDVAARVTFLSELASEKFIEFGAENTVGDKLALFADLRGHFVVLRVRNRDEMSWRAR